MKKLPMKFRVGIPHNSKKVGMTLSGERLIQDYLNKGYKVIEIADRIDDREAGFKMFNPQESKI